MSVIDIKHKGDFEQTGKLLTLISRGGYFDGLDRIAEEGVKALKEATPKRTGLTADSWGYYIKKTENRVEINWTNSNVNNGVNVAMLIQYGHGTSSGVYVEGVDYINPALKPVFDAIGAKVWKEVTRSGK